MGLGSVFGAAVGGIQERKKTKLEKAFSAGMKKHEELYSDTNVTDDTTPVGAYTGNTGSEVGKGSIDPEDANYVSTLESIDAKVLDAVAKNEGTEETGYNTEYAYGKFGKDRKAKFSDMTIAEVMAHQDVMLANQKDVAGVKSTAVGRYQMLKQTLKDEVGLAGIDVDKTKFTPELQDKLILQRLNRIRGYGDWKKGGISDEDFKHNMSKEFASIVNPKTGKGYYPGQGAKPLILQGMR